MFVEPNDIVIVLDGLIVFTGIAGSVNGAGQMSSSNIFGITL